MAQRDLDAALQLLAARAQFITGASGAAIALRRQGMNDMLCRASAGSNAPELGALLSTEFGLSGESVRTKQLLRCDDAERDARVNREVCRRLGIASVVVMPVVHDDEVLGVFELFSGKANAFGERDLSAVQRLGEMVETAVRLAHVTETLPQTLKTEQSLVAQPKSDAGEEQILDDEILSLDPEQLSGPVSEDADVLQPASETAGEAEQAELPAPHLAPAPSVSASALPHHEAAKNQSGETNAAVQAPPQAQAISNQPAPAPGLAPAKAPAEGKPLFWSAADASAGTEEPAPGDQSHVPPVLRGLRKCEACGFPISGGRVLCVECEEKRWRGQLKRPQPMPTGAIPENSNSKGEAKGLAAALAPAKVRSGNRSAVVPAAVALPEAKAVGAVASHSVSALRETGSGAAPSKHSENATPTFVLSAGMVESPSWISANKYVIGMLVLVTLIIGAFVLMR